MHNMQEKLEKIQDEIEQLEEAEMSWSNLEKLSILYNIEHHMCKKVEMLGEGLYSESEIGFQSNASNRGSRDIRQMTNGMSRQQLADIVVNTARDMRQNGNGNGYNRLYNRVARYDGNGGNGQENR